MIVVCGATVMVVVLVFCCQSMGEMKGRVVGGRFAEKGEFPYMVALSYRPNSVSCGGTILSKWHVLTACHCVVNVKNRFTRPSMEIRDSGNAKIIAGSLSRNVPEEQGYQVRNVHYWRHHPNCIYQHNQELKLDTAMIKLTQPFILNFLVQPIDFPRNITVWRNLVNRMQLENASCTTMGWGMTVAFHNPWEGKEQRSNPSEYLKGLNVNLEHIWTCFSFLCDFSVACMRRMFHQFRNGAQDRICADAGITLNGTVCSGDSGSPLICEGVLADFGSCDSVPEVNFYVVSRGEAALHYEKVKGSLGGTRGFRQVSDSPPIPTVVLLHGLESSYDSECNKKIAEGLLDRRGMNIVAVEYPGTAGGRGYDRAVRSTDAIGKEVGDFLLSSQTDGSLSLVTTTLIGFSLGAHVAGVAGYRIRESSGYLRTIIGLDPAKPAFINLPLESRLDRSDAGFVSVIHTADGFLGMEEAIGHADFYPNGGMEVQPLCQGHGLYSLICSHTAACDYLAESIWSPNSFIAEKCSSWEDYQLGRCRSHEKTFMGFDIDSKAEGVYFLKTHPESSGGAVDGAFEVVDVNTLSETDDDRILSQYHWYPRSGAAPASPLLSGLLPSCLLLPLRLYL